MAHALVVENADPFEREHIEAQFEPLGHDFRAAIDEGYKRATWGLRPEDVAEQQAIIGEMQGRR